MSGSSVTNVWNILVQWKLHVRIRTTFIPLSTSACVSWGPLCETFIPAGELGAALAEVPAAVVWTGAVPAEGVFPSDPTAAVPLFWSAGSPSLLTSSLAVFSRVFGLMPLVIFIPILKSLTFSMMNGRRASLTLPITWRVIRRAASCWKEDNNNTGKSRWSQDFRVGCSFCTRRVHFEMEEDLPTFLNLPMIIRLLSFKEQRCKDFWKSS